MKKRQVTTIKGIFFLWAKLKGCHERKKGFHEMLGLIYSLLVKQRENATRYS